MFNTILSIISSLINTLGTFFTYKITKMNIDSKENSERKELIKDSTNKLEETCNKGNISDLLDATKKFGDSIK